MRQATRLAEAGQLRPRVDPRQFTLETVADAHQAFKARTAAGKLIVDIAD